MENDDSQRLSQVPERDQHLLSPSDIRYTGPPEPDPDAKAPYVAPPASAAEAVTLPPVVPSTADSRSVSPYQGGQQHSASQNADDEEMPSPPRGVISKTKIFTIGDGIRIAPSLIPGAGRGAFVTRDVPEANSMFTEYGGRLIDAKDAAQLVKAKKDTHLRGLTPMHSAIDGIDVQDVKGGPAGSFVNDSRNASTLNCDWRKTDVVQPHGAVRSGPDDLTRIWLGNIKPLKSGDELYGPYGTSYWNRHAVVLDTAKANPQATVSMTDTKHTTTTPTPINSDDDATLRPLLPFVPLVMAVYGPAKSKHAARAAAFHSYDQTLKAIDALNRMTDLLAPLMRTNPS